MSLGSDLPERGIPVLFDDTAVMFVSKWCEVFTAIPLLITCEPVSGCSLHPGCDSLLWSCLWFDTGTRMVSAVNAFSVGGSSAACIKCSPEFSWFLMNTVVIIMNDCFQMLKQQSQKAGLTVHPLSLSLGSGSLLLVPYCSFDHLQNLLHSFNQQLFHHDVDQKLKNWTDAQFWSSLTVAGIKHQIWMEIF